MADMAARKEELSVELIDCARYGEDEEVKTLIEQNADVNYAKGDGNTALHMASANGHIRCVELLVTAGARCCANGSGNSPLHWAVQNKHVKLAKLLLKTCKDIDVLAKNGFGKSALTDAFGAGDAKLTEQLLAHKSAAGLEKDGTSSSGKADDDKDTDAAVPASDKSSEESLSAADSKIVQTYTYTFNFSSGAMKGPDIMVREVATDWAGDVFSSAATASEDTTGMQVWATSLVFARWIVSLQESEATSFAQKQVVELGAGTGVPGLTALFYSEATKVTMTDMFKHTMNNLRFNVALNLKSKIRSYEHVEVKSLDWTDKSGFETGAFDVVLGSDLVYEDEAVDLLISIVDHLLSPYGTFFLAAGAKRKGVDKLLKDFADKGYKVTSLDAPSEYLANPLASGDENELELHFNELSENTFTLHTIRRDSQQAKD